MIANKIYSITSYLDALDTRIFRARLNVSAPCDHWGENASRVIVEIDEHWLYKCNPCSSIPVLLSPLSAGLLVLSSASFF